jgi:hypothetical protein
VRDRRRVATHGGGAGASPAPPLPPKTFR